MMAESKWVPPHLPHSNRPCRHPRICKHSDAVACARGTCADPRATQLRAVQAAVQWHQPWQMEFIPAEDCFEVAHLLYAGIFIKPLKSTSRAPTLTLSSLMADST
jgi:hypothetical protein